MSLPGNPAALKDRADAYVNAARLIDQAADDLRRLAFLSESDAIDALQTKSIAVANDLDAAHGRYNGTAYALQEYAVTLQELHARADAAEASLAQANYRQRGVASNATATEARLEKALEDPATPTATIQQLEANLRQLDAQATAVAGTIDAAQGQINQAHADLEDAAQKAIDAIDSAIAATNEGLLDQIKKFVEDVGDFFDMVGQWINDVFTAVVDRLMAAIEMLATVLLVIMIVITAVLIVIAAIAVIGLLVAVLLNALLVIIGSPMFWVIAAVATAAAATLWLRTIAKEAISRPERHTDFDTEFTRGSGTNAPESYGDLFRDDLDDIDELGGESKTDIRVVAILDDDGNVVAWRVALPSTQNWNLDNTGGALNDVSADAALSTPPGVQTPYERAVWDALKRAGALDSGAPIMLTGWSLGGMMAANIATDPRISDRVESIVVGGSPIDKYRDELGKNIRVTSFENVIDPVHHAELWGFGFGDWNQPDGWATISGFDGRVHANGVYGTLADSTVGDAIRAGDAKFFADSDNGTTERVNDYFYSRSGANDRDEGELVPS